jgi:hypothetical protein
MADTRQRTGIVGDLRDTADLLQRYIRQETVDPVKGLGRYLGWGLAGSLLMSIGAICLVLSGMRALQTEVDTFDGNWSFVPYLLAMVALGLVIAWAAYGISRGGRGAGARS